MRSIFVVWLAFICSSACGQIDVPPSREVHSSIVATINAQVPEGATFSGGWTASEGVQFIPCGDNSIAIWAKPGKHSLKYAGFWVHTKTVTFTDGTGNVITIESYLGGGVVQEAAEFAVVGGPDPKPPQPPGPDPVQPGPKQIVFFVESNNLDKLPSPQRDLVTSLTVRQDLLDLGHKVVQVVDDDQIHDGVPTRWAPWVGKAIGKQLPLVGLADMDGGAIEIYPMPTNGFEGLLQLIGDTQ